MKKKEKESEDGECCLLLLLLLLLAVHATSSSQKAPVRSRIFCERGAVVLVDVHVLVRRDGLEQLAQTFV
jgi:hypothetical protein